MNILFTFVKRGANLTQFLE